MVRDDRDTSFVGTDRFRLRRCDRSRAERDAVTISVADSIRVAGDDADAIRLATLGPKRGRGALKDLSDWRGL